MNCTNNIPETAEAPHLAPDWLAGEIRARHLPLESNATPAQVIPFVQKFIKRHLEIGTLIPQGLDSYPKWKATLADWQQFLARVETLTRLPFEHGTAKFHPGEIATTPAAFPCKKQTDDHAINNDHNPDSLIKKVEKYLAENHKTSEAPAPQPLTSNSTPSNDPSDPRRTPVDDPSIDASDASTDASFDGPFTGLFGVTRQSREAGRAELDLERAAYLAQLLRETSSGKSPIDDLPPERQQSLYQLIQDAIPLTSIVRLIGAPEPQGWNFKTCDNSLRRFKKRYGKRLEAAELAAAMADANQTIQQTGANEETYTDATRRLLKIRLYRNAADPNGSGDKLELLTRLLDRQRRTDLSERRVRVLEHRVQQSK